MQPKTFYTPFIFLLSILVSTQIKAQQPTSVAKINPQAQQVNANFHANYTFTILTGAGNVYGYNILKNGIVVIHHPAQPAADKTLTLKTTIQATRAAMFVMYKMRNNIQPATLSTDELKKVTLD